MITFTDNAKDKVHFYMKDRAGGAWAIRIRTSGPTKFDFSLEEVIKKNPTDNLLQVDDFQVIVDAKTAQSLAGATVDFVETPFSQGFKVETKAVAVDPKGPDLSDPVVQQINDLLTKEINPSLASHGGVARLLEVKNQIVYLQLGGGCQGCGSATATLKQGIETRIKEAIPSIISVVDQTDHASGTNPYFQPHH